MSSEPDRDSWEAIRSTKVDSVYSLVDLLINLSVLGIGFDLGSNGVDMTYEYVDRHWKN